MADGRGFTDEQVERGAKRLWDGWHALGQRQDDGTIRPGPWETSPLQDIEREIVRAVLDAVFEPGPPRAASPNPSSGAAPKGEQEEIQARIDAEAERWSHGWTMERDGKVVPRPSPPPDRLTPEERTAILAAVEYFLAAEHDGRHEAESGATHSGYAKLARLSGREPEA